MAEHWRQGGRLRGQSIVESLARKMSDLLPRRRPGFLQMGRSAERRSAAFWLEGRAAKDWSRKRLSLRVRPGPRLLSLSGSTRKLRPRHGRRFDTGLRSRWVWRRGSEIRGPSGAVGPRWLQAVAALCVRNARDASSRHSSVSGAFQTVGRTFEACRGRQGQPTECTTLSRRTVAVFETLAGLSYCQSTAKGRGPEGKSALGDMWRGRFA